jgi:hypothetical protein
VVGGLAFHANRYGISRRQRSYTLSS